MDEYQLESLKEKAQLIYDRLLDYFGMPEIGEPDSPLETLICTILSQNNNDRNRDIAYEALIKRFPDWAAVRDANPEDVMDAIRPAGLANQKGPRIQQVLRQIAEERGNLSLDFLSEFSVEEAMSWLTSFKGVGPKTASIVLLFCLGMPVFPVDTHVYRVTGRLGIRPLNLTADQSHPFLASIFNPEIYMPGHLILIRLGREICHARKPNCENCPLIDICNYYQNINNS
jgi:endonuclease-3